jgi:hypothetical protein
MAVFDDHPGTNTPTLMFIRLVLAVLKLGRFPCHEVDDVGGGEVGYSSANVRERAMVDGEASEWS